MIAEVTGTLQPEEIIVVGAHYDTTPDLPGASDNAGGVGVVMELARLYAERGSKRTLRFVAWGAEEGGLIGSRLAVGPRWHRILPIGLLATGGLLVLASLAPLMPERVALTAMFVLMGLVGIAGGMVLVPCEAFVQTRASGDRKGIVIASVNFAVFVGIFMSAPAANVLNALLLPTSALAAVGLATLPFGAWLARALSREAKERP